MNDGGDVFAGSIAAGPAALTGSGVGKRPTFITKDTTDNAIYLGQEGKGQVNGIVRYAYDATTIKWQKDAVWGAGKGQIDANDANQRFSNNLSAGTISTKGGLWVVDNEFDSGMGGERTLIKMSTSTGEIVLATALKDSFGTALDNDIGGLTWDASNNQFIAVSNGWGSN